MPLINEHQADNIKWYKVSGVPDKFDKLAVYNDDIYLPIEAYNLTKANIVAYMVETNSGDAFITPSGMVYISGQTAIDMASQAQPDKVDELEECISLLFEKAMESELIQYPINEKLL